MHYSSQIIALSILPILSSVRASPLQSRDAACSASSPSSNCWDTLSMTDYLNEFGKEVSCKTGEAWSTCFFRTVAKEPEVDCSDFLSTTCTEPIPSANGDARAYYAAYNIFNTRSYLKSWSDALNDIVAEVPDRIKDNAQPAGTDEFKPQSGGPGVCNIDIALSNMVHQLNRAQEPADTAFLAFLKIDPSTLTYNTTSNSGVAIGNQLQQRLVEVMGKISTDLPSFLDLVDGGEFSKKLLYNVQTIDSIFFPQPETVDVNDGTVG